MFFFCHDFELIFYTAFLAHDLLEPIEIEIKFDTVLNPGREENSTFG
jgi:hypothetical protein